MIKLSVYFETKMSTSTEKKILSALFEKQIYPSNRFLPVVTRNLQEADILREIKSLTAQQIIGPIILDQLDELKEIYPEVARPFEIPDGKYNNKEPNKYTSHQVINSDQKLLYSRVVKEFSTPTTYLTPKGSITIDFDVDRKNIISEYLASNPLTDWYCEYLADRFLYYENVLFMRYFAEF